MNTGALIGPIPTGWGWQAGGFPRLRPGRNRYGCRPDSVLADPQEPARLRAPRGHPFTGAQSVTSSLALVGIVVVLGILLATGLMTADNLKNWVMGFIFIGAIALFASAAERQGRNLRTSVPASPHYPLWIANAVFWALYQQHPPSWRCTRMNASTGTSWAWS